MLKALTKKFNEDFPEFVEVNEKLGAAAILAPRFGFTFGEIERMYYENPDKLELYLMAVE